MITCSRPDNMNVYLVGQEWTSKCDKTISPCPAHPSFGILQLVVFSLTPKIHLRWKCWPLSWFFPTEVGLLSWYFLTQMYLNLLFLNKGNFYTFGAYGV